MNSTNDFPNCNLPPTDIVYFNYADGNQNNFCQSYQGAPTASTSPFNWAPFVGVYDVYASYSGDANYAPAVSPVIAYRIGADPTGIVSLTASQQAPIGSVFPAALKALVRDSRGVAVNGLNVVFTAPAGGPGGTFAGAGSSITVTTGSDGTATAPAFTANTIPGTFGVTAAVAGFPALTISFALANTALSPAPQLTALIASRTGALTARDWTLTVVDHGGPASQVAISGLTFQQTGGPACSAAPGVLSTFPQAVNGSGQTNVAVNFGGCASTSRFTVTIQMSAAGGYTASTTLGNQFP